MIAPAIAAIMAYVAAHYPAPPTGLPILWRGQNWGDSNPQGTGSAFIEAEILGGVNSLHSFSSPGNRLFIHPGLIRFYICVPQGTGMTDAYTVADALAAIMERKEFGQAAGQTVRTLDFSANDGVASLEDGNYSVLLGSVPFDYWYTN